MLDGFELKGDAKIIRYPETYTSKEGENMYDIVKRLLAKTFICPGAEAAA